MDVTNVGEATPQTIVARPPTHPPQAEEEQNGGDPREKVNPSCQDQVLPTPVKVDRLWDLLEGYDEGMACYMAKTDIKSAFRIVPIHPSDQHLLGFKWQGKYYFDRCLPMGCSASCNIFKKLSTALQWAAQQRMHDVEMLHIQKGTLSRSPPFFFGFM